MAPINAMLSLAFFAAATFALPWDMPGFSHFHYEPVHNEPKPFPHPPHPYPHPPPSYAYPTMTPTASFYPTGTAGTGTGTGTAASTGFFPMAYPTAPVPTGYGWKRDIDERQPPFDFHGHKQYGGPRGHGHQPFYPIPYGPKPPGYPTAATTGPTAAASTGFIGTAPAPTGYYTS